MNLSILQNNDQVKNECAICHQEHKPDIPFDVFLDSDEAKPVCMECTKKHAPRLHALLALFYQQSDDCREEIETAHLEPAERISRMLEDVKQAAAALTPGMPMLLNRVYDLHCSIGNLSEFIKWHERNLKQEEAQRAIKLLKKEGFSFERVTLGDFKFEEVRFAKGEYVPKPDDDDGIPF